MSIMSKKAIYYRDIECDKPYSDGMGGGQIQKDSKTGKVFHKRIDGTIAEIKPHESSIFYKLDGVDYCEVKNV
jgi:hypothetical protein